MLSRHTGRSLWPALSAAGGGVDPPQAPCWDGLAIFAPLNSTRIEPSDEPEITATKNKSAGFDTIKIGLLRRAHIGQIAQAWHELLPFSPARPIGPTRYAEI